ncbi:MAG TPA: tRNA (adenosine(37)-N6)-threonylcarbamoyltransferase complex ATPase subunit type 1 TsaE [Candidatus Acidoferrum sp.]|nr:tRNA (adenosine(37)-N6)-threonylcarbamoyltransferase complex ATPase subunit type 1 TsaE [Candidatus Acidoferrum sp.]
MQSEEFVTNSAEETTQLGRRIAARLSVPALVLLKGDLGAGKTTLTKGIIAGLGTAEEEEVTSPTFTLIHVFQRPGAQPMKVYHADLYRIEGPQGLDSLGLDDILSEPCILIVEWSERLTLRSDWPIVRIELEHLGGDRRTIRVTGLEAFAAGSNPASQAAAQNAK